ncbi:PREDICTED: uncharacterized protein LOC109225707 isoform X2 [Nicotiana attenuata]|uniref:uncharacterized protein LOC109225707 isoform X2 n=1 Tax=Nicotiana attenuata TaxID=49451 RepID=UPI0009049AC8|nr:PREDICTED: uncharacterized protein LOC109225707 isoform X2 [Nicotiana attenuata]
MDSGQTNKRPYEKKYPDRNVRRREQYKVKMANEKSALALHEVLTSQVLQRSRFDRMTSTISTDTSSGHLQYTPNIMDSSYTSKTESKVTLLPSFPAFDKRNPLCTYEKGSTSAVPNEQNDTAEIVITKGRSRNNRTAMNIKLRSDYVPLKNTQNCKFCSAKRFEYESPGFCCGTGTVKIISHRMPAKLHNLYFENNEKSQHFRTYIRTYNNSFAFTSLGVNYDTDLARRNRGIYTFRVQGRMYHLIDDLYPGGKKSKNLQLYFYDNNNELANRMACSNKINESIVSELMDMLKVNPYSFFIRSLIDIPELQNFHIGLKCDPGLDQRVYNLPTSSEIAAIWVEDNDNNITHAHIFKFIPTAT